MLHTKPNKRQYPQSLTEISHPPSDLYIQSNNWSDILKMPMLAVVGSRKVTPYGRAVTEQLVRGAVAHGIAIVSGLALGLDAIAHQSALEAGGITVAVLPCGLDMIYPSAHHQLARQIIVKGGALVSQYPPHSKIAFKSNFVARNRIVSGLSKAVLIPEATINSGSLHTANFALEQGKDVLVVPGPITSPQSAGCNSLLKTGATPITTLDDLLDYFNISLSAHDGPMIPDAANAAEYIIINLIANNVNDIDELHAKSGLSTDVFQQTLSMLEITGKITPIGGGQWTLR